MYLERSNLNTFHHYQPLESNKSGFELPKSTCEVVMSERQLLHAEHPSIYRFGVPENRHINTYVFILFAFSRQFYSFALVLMSLNLDCSLCFNNYLSTMGVQVS